MKRKIGKLMIVLGIGILLVPGIGSIYTYYKTQMLYKGYLQAMEQLERPLATDSPIGTETTNRPVEEVAMQEGDILESEMGNEGIKDEGDLRDEEDLRDIEVIGKITIPAIKSNLLLLEGVSNKALKLGAGHMTGTALPGEIGNCAIAGHRNYTFGQIFNRLDEVKLGDEIGLEVGEKNYTYKVSEMIIVEPEDLSVLKQSKDKRQVTLITCHPIYKATHRLIVVGELIKEEDVIDEDKKGE